MIPERIKLEYIDEGIRELAVNLNKIPEVHTQTTCEGHIWRETPAWPTKNGWVHFVIPENKHRNLIKKIEEHCNKWKIFILESSNWDRGYANHNSYTLSGNFESHGDGNLFNRINKEEQEAYFRRAGKRKKNLLRGWSVLNQIVVDYIKENISEDVEALPYR